MNSNNSTLPLRRSLGLLGSLQSWEALDIGREGGEVAKRAGCDEEAQETQRDEVARVGSSDYEVVEAEVDEVL